jgi:hypothetical protein
MIDHRPYKPCGAVNAMTANPQLENGYTQIANELIEALARFNLSPYESRLLWYIARKTYGYQKKTDAISLGWGVLKTSIHRRSTSDF